MGLYRVDALGEVIDEVIARLSEGDIPSRERQLLGEYLRLLCEHAVLHGDMLGLVHDRDD